MSNRKKLVLAGGCLALGASVAFGGAVKATSPVVVDGKLDEQAWKDAQWERKMNRLDCQTELGPFVRQTEFAFVWDEHTLYFAMRGTDPDMARFRTPRNTVIWDADPVEIFLAPTGTHFDHYQFVVAPFSKNRYAAFYSEGGDIQPDPFDPEWRHAFDFSGKDAWTVEIAVPLSSLYMTRNASWKNTWRVNVTRTTIAKPVEYATWSKMQRVFNEPEHLGTMGGFPTRAADDDFAVTSAIAETSDGPDGRIAAKIRLAVHAEVGGDFRVTLPEAAADARVTLKRGDNEVVVDGVFPKNGRYRTPVVFERLSDGARFRRWYPVLVDYRPIRVKLTTPQYRNNFYPGQCSDVVKGTVTVGKGVTAELTLEGPGFPARRASVTTSGDFSFDTKGFAFGDATLVVRTSDHVERIKVRKLPPRKTLMTWVENGNLVVNGKPTLRRNIYALGYRSGRKADAKYDREMKPLVTTELDAYYSIAPDRVVKGLASSLGTQDVRPPDEYFRSVDAMIEKAKDEDFLGWYVADEPECFGMSPVFLRHIYEYVAEKDPYHVTFSASRGGKTYLECADMLETHPYLSAENTPEGERRYGTPPWMMGRYVDAFGAADRPDKVIGYLPTAFAYIWTSLREDYPTFDEYRVCTWAAMMRGGKTLWPYAGHDLADRPSIWHGTICIFESFRALEDFILNGRRTTFVNTDQVEGARYVLPDAEMFVVVNKRPTPATIELKGFSGSFREFRGSRTFTVNCQLPTTVSLQPFEVIVATTKPYDAGLRPLTEVRGLALREEAERKGRDNQLLERCADIDFESNFVGSHCGTWSKLFDGMYDQLARSSEHKTDCYIDLAFRNGLRPVLRRLNVHGFGIFDKVVASVWKEGKWERLAPEKVEKAEYLVKLDFGKDIPLDRLRLEFPGEPGARNALEVYEIELPTSVE